MRTDKLVLGFVMLLSATASFATTKCPCDDAWSKLKRNYVWKIMWNSSLKKEVDRLISRSYYDATKGTHEGQAINIGNDVLDNRGLYCSSGYTISRATPEQVESSGNFRPRGEPAIENALVFLKLTATEYDACALSLEKFEVK
jgi:hypothetical protein